MWIMLEQVKGHLLRELELSLDKTMMICQVEEKISKQIKFLSEEEPDQGSAGCCETDIATRKT